MELLMILTYTAICVAVFKIFRIPVNKWTLPTAALGGIFLITGILVMMNYNHPFTKNARIYFATLCGRLSAAADASHSSALQ